MSVPTPTPVRLELAAVTLLGDLFLPDEVRGLVVFAHGDDSSRKSPRNRTVASSLAEAGLASLLFDLLRGNEAEHRGNVFDIGLLSRRLAGAVEWCREQPRLGSLPIGLFGAGTGAAAALVTAARHPDAVAAVVSRGGRPDLAASNLPHVTAPTLLVVGGADVAALRRNRDAADHLTGVRRLEVIPRAGNLLEEAGEIERVTELAQDWFFTHLPEVSTGEQSA